MASEITFPRLLGYRYEIADGRLHPKFTADARVALSTADLPTRTESAPIVGEHSIHTLDDLKRRRPNEVAFTLAKLVLETYFRDSEPRADSQVDDRPWLFPQVLAITKQWMAECITLKDHTFVQMLLLTALANDAAAKIYRAIVQGSANEPILKPVLQPYDTLGSTRYVDFDTTRPTYLTHYQRCHISHVALDSSWEATLAERLEEMDEVRRYVKNQSLGFTIPYTFNGTQRQYVPDYIVCVEDGHGPENLLNLIIEVTGERKKDKAARVDTARTLWVPAVNNHGGFGRWAFLEITDPWDAVNTIRAQLPSH